MRERSGSILAHTSAPPCNAPGITPRAVFGVFQSSKNITYSLVPFWSGAFPFFRNDIALEALS